jgi:tetratricopeptide (TPR) repeat protein
MKKWLFRAFFLMLAAGIVAFYVYDVRVNHTHPSENLFRTIAIVCICISGFLRVGVSASRRSLKFYDAQYADILGNAFVNQPFWRNKMLCAVRLYNENNYDKALKYLADMKQRCQTQDDIYAVMLFIALCFTDMEMYDHAEKAYMQMIFAEIADSRIFSNLGNVLNRKGDYERAIENFEHALEYDRNNAFAYNNIAQAHFQMHKLEDAITFAEKALAVNPKLSQASSLLAIIYDLMDDQEKSKHYFHIAISSGYNPTQLKEAMEFYRNSKMENGEENAVSEA